MEFRVVFADLGGRGPNPLAPSQIGRGALVLNYDEDDFVMSYEGRPNPQPLPKW
jgi:hypothetical protein